MFHLLQEFKRNKYPWRCNQNRESCFFDCVRLAKITLPKSLIKIERECFSQCYSLNEVICYAINPPAAEYAFDTFENLYVPDESYDKYCNDKDWGTHCTNIIPLYGLKFEYNEDTKEATLINNNYSGEITIPSETIKMELHISSPD